MIHLHHARHHQPVNLRTQAADVGGEFERQHGHGAVGEINAGAAQPRFLIERGLRRNVLGHIGNVNLQLEVAIIEMADEDGVIEVTRGFAVNGNDGQIAKVAAASKFRAGDDLRDVLGFFQSRRRKMVRQVKLADHDFYVNPKIVRFAQNLNYAAARALRGRGPISYFCVNHQAFKIVPFGAANDFMGQLCGWFL